MVILKKYVKGSGDITMELMQVKHLTSKLKKMNVDEIIDDDRKVFISKMLKSEPKWEGMKAMVNCHVADKLLKLSQMKLKGAVKPQQEMIFE